MHSSFPSLINNSTNHCIHYFIIDQFSQESTVIITLFSQYIHSAKNEANELIQTKK